MKKVKEDKYCNSCDDYKKDTLKILKRDFKISSISSIDRIESPIYYYAIQSMLSFWLYTIVTKDNGILYFSEELDGREYIPRELIQIDKENFLRLLNPNEKDQQRFWQEGNIDFPKYYLKTD